MPTLTHLSPLTSVALAPGTPVTCEVPGCLLPLPRLPRPGSQTAGAESLASEHHFLSGALPPASRSGKLFISHKDSDRDRICGTLSVWAQMSASVADASSPCCASPSRSLLLPPPEPLLPGCRGLAETQQGGERRAAPLQPGASKPLGKRSLESPPPQCGPWVPLGPGLGGGGRGAPDDGQDSGSLKDAKEKKEMPVLLALI